MLLNVDPTATTFLIQATSALVTVLVPIIAIAIILISNHKKNSKNKRNADQHDKSI